MQELWVCERCRSLNRAHVKRCYRCGTTREGVPPPVREQPPAPQPVAPAPRREVQLGVAPDVPVRYGYIPAWPLGYLSAALFGVVFLGLVALAACWISLLVSGVLLGPSPLSDDELVRPVLALGVVTVLAFLVGAVCHSVFLALADYDVPALGGGVPRYHPVRALFWWIEIGFWATLAGLVFNLPLMLVLFIFAFVLVLSSLGILVGGVAFCFILYMISSIGFHPMQWLSWPQRLLSDLDGRLAVPGRPDSHLVTYLNMAWITANGVWIAVLLISWVVGIVLIAVGFGSIAAQGTVPFESSGVLEFDRDLIAVAAIVQFVAAVAVYGLLAAVTFSFSQRLRLLEQPLGSTAMPEMPQLPAQPAGADRP